MRRTVMAIILILGLLLIPSAVSAASGIQIVSETGDGTWTNDTWQVDMYPGESKSTTITLYNSSSSSLDVEVTIAPDSSDNGNLIFELNKSNFTMSEGSYTDVILIVKANGSTAPGIYTADLEIKFAQPPLWDPWSYDENGDGYIQKSEVLGALADYFDGGITKPQVLDVLLLYFDHVWNAWIYDENSDGEIQKSEAIQAIVDYFDGLITKSQVLEVINLYVTHTH